MKNQTIPQSNKTSLWVWVTAYTRYYLSLLGWAGWVGFSLMVVAALWQVIAVHNLDLRLAELKQKRIALETLIAQGAAARVGSSEERLNDFYAFLPGNTAPAMAIEQIHAAAQERGVLLATGEYKALRDNSVGAGPKVLRYQMVYPLKGTYTQVRAWLGDVMNGLPGLALDDINFRREGVGSEMLEARVRLTLFYKAK